MNTLKNITLSEVKKIKKVAVNAIQKEIKSFEDQTGITVEEIGINIQIDEKGNGVRIIEMSFSL